MGRTAFLYSDDFLSYDLGGAHPLQQRRLQMVYRLLGAYGVLAPEGPIEWKTPVPATQEEILRVHTPDFVAMVMRAGTGYRGPDLKRYGLSDGDTPAFNSMYEAAALYAGGTVEAARLLLTGNYDYAFNVAGGLHHAHPDHASGFCTFNDLAMGALTLRDGGLQRVVYIDIDAHHGDGVQACFYDDPETMTISLHESGQFLFPGTGFAEEVGNGAAAGTSLNIPYYPYTLDDVWHNAFDAVIPDALARFKPDAVIFQFGADAHWEDPLAHLLITSEGWMRMVDKLFRLTQGLPAIVTGGGGYNIKTVARLWTMVAARCAEIELPDQVPASYAAQYDIHYLHDRETPQVEESVQRDARAYVENQLETLKALI